MTVQIPLSPKLTSLEKQEQPMNSNEVNRTAPKLVTYLAILGCLGTGLAGWIPCVLHGECLGLIASSFAFGIPVHCSFR